jgi:uncharacterized DUF497 family protein
MDSPSLKTPKHSALYPQSVFLEGQVVGAKPALLASPYQSSDDWMAYGQTAAGRHLVVFFIRKPRSAALPISAREMTRAERRYFHEQKEAD